MMTIGSRRSARHSPSCAPVSATGGTMGRTRTTTRRPKKVVEARLLVLLTLSGAGRRGKWLFWPQQRTIDALERDGMIERFDQRMSRLTPYGRRCLDHTLNRK